MRTLDRAIRSYKKELKELIKKYEEELNNNGFELIYYKLTELSKGRMYNLITAFTALLLKNNINPLEYTSYIPARFAYELDIKEFVIPNNITYIGEYAFGYCESLTSITIPKSVTMINDYAFNYCINLKDIYYTGSERDWKNIKIRKCNDNLLSANIYYNS